MITSNYSLILRQNHRKVMTQSLGPNASIEVMVASCTSFLKDVNLPNQRID